MDAILPLLIFVMVFIVARKWVHDKDSAGEIPREVERPSRTGLTHSVRGR